MTKFIKKFIGLALGLGLVFGTLFCKKDNEFACVYAEQSSLEITKENVNNFSNMSSYDDGAVRTIIGNDYGIKAHNIMKNNKNSPTGSSNGQYIQMQGSSKGNIYNTVAIPNIKSITVVKQDSNDMKCYIGGEGQLVSDSKSNSATTIINNGSETSDKPSKGTTMVWTSDMIGLDVSYFALVGAGTHYLISITIEYDTSSTTSPSIEFEDEFLYKHVSVGDSFQYKVKTENIGDAQVTFSSDNEDAATIDSTTGVVNCLSVNVVNITASVTVGGETYSVTTELWILFGEPEVYKNASIQDVIDSDEYNSRAFELEVTIKGWGIDGTDASPNDYGDMLVTDGNNDFPIYGLSNIPTDLEWDGQWCNYTTSRRNTFNTASPTNLLTIGSIIPVKGFKVNMGPYKALSCVLIGAPTINELKSISITPVENKEYNVGDSVSPEDFSASVTHSLTGNESISSSDCTISPETFTTGGDAVPVTVSYTDRSGTISNTYYVKVNVPEIDIEIITIDEKDNYVKVLSTSTYQLRYSVEPQNQNETIIWESENPNIATVDENGLVTPVSEGITIISASGNRSGESDLCMIEVVHGSIIDLENEDIITITTTGITKTSYTDFSNKKVSSNAIYAGRTLKNTEKNSNGCMQLNGSSGYIYTTESGGIFGSFSIDCCFLNGKTINIYGSHEPFKSNALNDDAEIIASLSENGTAVASEDYEYIAIRTTGYMAFNSITINWKTSYTATLEDMEFLNTYVDLYLGPEVAGEYNPITNKGTGLCISEGLYADAKNEFNNTLSDEQRAIFTQDDYFAEPRERLLAWAKANNDSLDSKTYLLSARQRIGGNDFPIFNGEEDSTILILIISMSAMSSIGILYILKKKKEN